MERLPVARLQQHTHAIFALLLLVEIVTVGSSAILSAAPEYESSPLGRRQSVPFSSGRVGNLQSVIAQTQEERLKSAIALTVASVPPDWRLPQALNTLAEFYMEKGRYDKALHMYQRSLPLMEQILGPEHRETIVTLANMCVASINLTGELEVKPLCERALRIREKTFGPNHPDIACSLSDLAFLYVREGTFAKAETLLRRAVAMMELFPTSEFAAVPLNNLADLYARKKKFRLAAETFARSLAWAENNYGAEHPSIVSTLSNLGWAHLLDKNTQEAEAVFRRALTIVEKSQELDHIDCVGPLLGLARATAVSGRRPEAEALLQRARRLIDSAVPSNSRLMEEWAMASREVSQTRRRK